MAGYLQLDISACGRIITNPSATTMHNLGSSDVPEDHDSLEKGASQSKVSESQEIMVETICDETSV